MKKGEAKMFKRHRKLRKNEVIRNLVKDVYIAKEDLIYPIFIEEGENIKNEIPSMPGIFRYSIDRLSEELDELVKLGINSILLFGIPKNKDACATEAYNENGVIQNAVRFIKKKYNNFLVICDICCCEYTSHGHCGILDENGYVKNDETLEVLAKTALSYARAGADIVAPSDMMDGRVEKISKVLAENNFENIPIMAYSVKYSSAFYGPFRDAADSAPQFGDRKSYQMNFQYSKDAIDEVAEDLRQGADIIIVKPAMAYLDVIKKVSDKFEIPIVAYSVSGEYSMVKAAAQNEWIDEMKIVMEQMYAMKRAGANAIITYYAKEVAKFLENSEN